MVISSGLLELSEAVRQSLLTDMHPSAEYFVTPSLAGRLHDLDKEEVGAARYAENPNQRRRSRQGRLRAKME